MGTTSTLSMVSVDDDDSAERVDEISTFGDDEIEVGSNCVGGAGNSSTFGGGTIAVGNDPGSATGETSTFDAEEIEVLIEFTGTAGDTSTFGGDAMAVGNDPGS